MGKSLITEIPYREDSTALFEAIVDWPWAVFLDSGKHHLTQSRYDILAAEPYATVLTRGNMTEIKTGEISQVLPDDPFQLLRQQIKPFNNHGSDLPFYGGAIGYFSYDLGRRIESFSNKAEDAEKMPEMAVGLYDWAVVVDHLEHRSWLASAGRVQKTKESWNDLVRCFSQPVSEKIRTPFQVKSAVASNMTSEYYVQAFNKIKGYIDAGDCYQVNLAQRFSAPAQGDPWLAYQALRIMNPAPFSAYINLPFAQVLSASPERFLKLRKGEVETKPIKGTRPRAGHPRLDAALAESLRESEKDRAENLMIVDLLRNDLSKTCLSVRVPKLFDIESFSTVHHMVSTVTGKLEADKDALDLLRGCFPGGSITGAPKLRAMEIIEELEPHRRGIYCGAIGYIGGDGDMDCNIAIRTLVYSGGVVRFWAGGGIVADSKVQEEYQESFDKAAAMLRLLQQDAASHVGG